MIRLTQSLNIIAVFVWVRAPLPFSLGTPPLQTIDAVLQLTEAEKVSRALGMTESAKRIRAMMEEIRQGD